MPHGVFDALQLPLGNAAEGQADIYRVKDFSLKFKNKTSTDQSKIDMS